MLRKLCILPIVVMIFCSDKKEEEILIPPARDSHSATFNTDAGELNVFGGSTSGGADNGLWTFKNFWKLANKDVINPREDALMVYHTDHKKVYLLGGRNLGLNTVLNDFWNWDGSQWIQVGTLPFQLVHAAAVYDKKNNRILVFGGSSTSLTSDLWVWNGTTWSKSSATGPEARLASSLVYSQTNQKVYLFGGSISNGTPFTDVWELDGNTWTKINNSMPAVLPGAYGVAEAGNGEFLLFGGFLQTGQPFAETWLWNGTTWTKLNVTGPSGRALHTLSFDPSGNRVLLFGGSSGESQSSELWEFKNHAWLKK